MIRPRITAVGSLVVYCLASLAGAQEPYPSTYPTTGVPQYAPPAVAAPAGTVPYAAPHIPANVAPVGTYPNTAGDFQNLAPPVATGQPVTTGPALAPAPANPAANPPVAEPTRTPPVEIERAEILAWVGSEPILAGDVLPSINELLAQNAEQLAAAPEEEVKRLRRMLMKREVDRMIDNKLLLVEAKRNIPAEALDGIYTRIEKEFEESQLPRLYKSTNTTTRAQLETYLRTLGSSIDQQKRSFRERMLGGQWMRQQVKTETEITHQQMLKYYWDHIEEYEKEAKARWEEISVDILRFDSKGDAYHKLAEMGNVVFQGTNLADVAKAESHGVTAFEGGQYDWTTRGALVSQELNLALFTLPVGQLSPIIETATSFHIIRVLERVDAGRVPFVEAQVEIKKTLQDEYAKDQLDVYVKKLRSSTRVWTVFDGQTASR